MKKRQFWVSLIAGLLAALMVFGLIASAIPTYAGAAKSSSEIKKEIEELKKKQKETQSQIAVLEGQLSDNMDKMEEMFAYTIQKTKKKSEKNICLKDQTLRKI